MSGEPRGRLSRPASRRSRVRIPAARGALAGEAGPTSLSRLHQIQR